MKSRNYKKNSYKGKFDEEMIRKLIASFQQDAEERKAKEEAPENRCRKCGKYVLVSSSTYVLRKMRLCEECSDKMMAKLAENFLKDIPNLCPRCKSHPNACICPERKALKQLKK